MIFKLRERRQVGFMSVFNKNRISEDEEYLSTMKSYQQDKHHKNYNVEKQRQMNIRLIIGGFIFLVLMLLFDIGFRKYRYSESTQETIFYILFLMSAVGVLQIPIGMYGFIKTLWNNGSNK